MRLSEAIRLGSMLGPQAFGGFTEERFIARETQFFGTIVRSVKAYCAFGAAYEAATGGRHTMVVATEASAAFRGTVQVGETFQLMETPPEWPVYEWTSCPQCDLSGAVKRLIPHLNDDHRWTREAIADWVEQIEQQQEAEQEIYLMSFIEGVPNA